MKKGRMGINSLMQYLETFINIFCVIALVVQVLAIIIMVFGRYLFGYVPQGIEQLALFCMVWFSLLSISLSVQDEAHVKMEIIDGLVKPSSLRYFQIFAAIIGIIFSVIMFIYGISLVKLTKSSVLSGIRISEGWLYLSLPISGLFIILANIAVLVNKTKQGKGV